ALVGAPGTNGQAGSVYVYRLESVVGGANWTQRQKLAAADSAANAVFGSSLAVSGSTLAVGAPFDSAVAFNGGAAYVFTTGTSGISWTQRTRLPDPGVHASGYLGSSIGLSGGTIVVGALGYLNSHYAGAAYFYTGSGATWTLRDPFLSFDDGH